MQNRWSDIEAEKFIQPYLQQNIDRELALRVYSSRLLGQDQRLVMHGGGNTSVKITQQDIFQQSIEVLCVKGSGWDLETIEPAGLPAVKLLPLLQLRALDKLSDEDMVNFQRLNLLDFSAPNPSIETLLHAFIPDKFVNHTHSNAILSLTNQPNGAELIANLFGKRVAIVPYIKPGFDLAKKAVEVYEQHPGIEGLVLLKHGIFSFGSTAKESYDRMIDLVNSAEQFIQKNSKTGIFTQAALPKNLLTIEEIAPVLRGLCAEPLTSGKHKYRRMILQFRTNSTILNYVGGAKLKDYSQRGVVTPDHIIRTKNFPLVLPAPTLSLADYRQTIIKALNDYKTNYHAYFKQHARNHTELDRYPRVILIPEVGLFALDKSAKEATIVADLAEATIETITDAENIGHYTPLSAAELFEMEYWSLEQAKLSKQKEQAFSRKVVVITGGAGTIGIATAKAFKDLGAEILLLDVDQEKLTENAAKIKAKAFVCDLTDREAVKKTFDKICCEYGGLDILVSNAGKAITGSMLELTEQQLLESLKINFLAHQFVAQCAVDIMLKQNIGGVLLFNVSKQALNPGVNFGAYGIAKSATLALAKQYALEYGTHGIRSNIVNADRIRSGLLTDEMITARAKDRGLSTEDYMAGNLLSAEVTAEDVAQAFVHQALAEKTTANILTVDGGNMAAAVR